MTTPSKSTAIFAAAATVASILGVLTFLISCSTAPKGVVTDPAVKSQAFPRQEFEDKIDHNSQRLLKDGRDIFRYDTFGSEDFWGGKIHLHQAILKQDQGGVGAGVSARQALQLGLKVDSDKLPRILGEAIKGGTVDLDDPNTTLELLRADSVVGLKGVFDQKKQLVSLGITCALCHSTVDDSYAKEIGRRLDGWPNRDLNVGAIVASAPTVKPMADLLQISEEQVRQVLKSWGPGRYDAELNQDGKATRPDGKTAATLIPGAYGLAGQNLYTYTGWGSIPYWNAYVANTQMYGKGTFFDPRLANPTNYPVAARSGSANKRDNPDLITPKLAALQFYQLAIPAPQPPKNSYDEQSAQKGKTLFASSAKCATCHVPPLFSEPGWPMHAGWEIGIDDFQSNRSPDKRYRTTPLAGLFARSKGGFYHDGRFATLADVVNHYDRVFRLGLDDAQKHDLVEYLKSL